MGATLCSPDPSGTGTVFPGNLGHCEATRGAAQPAGAQAHFPRRRLSWLPSRRECPLGGGRSGGAGGASAARSLSLQRSPLAGGMAASCPQGKACRVQFLRRILHQRWSLGLNLFRETSFNLSSVCPVTEVPWWVLPCVGGAPARPGSPPRAPPRPASPSPGRPAPQELDAFCRQKIPNQRPSRCPCWARGVGGGIVVLCGAVEWPPREMRSASSVPPRAGASQPAATHQVPSAGAPGLVSRLWGRLGP